MVPVLTNVEALRAGWFKQAIFFNVMSDVEEIEGPAGAQGKVLSLA